RSRGSDRRTRGDEGQSVDPEGQDRGPVPDLAAQEDRGMGAMIRLRDITSTGWLVVACLALALILLTMCAVDCRHMAADRLRQADAGKTLAEARTAAAQDASAIRDRADARDQQIDQSTQETTDAIRNAPDDAAAGDHGLRSLCKRYPDRDPRCRMRDARPGRVG